MQRNSLVMKIVLVVVLIKVTAVHYPSSSLPSPSPSSPFIPFPVELFISFFSTPSPVRQDVRMKCVMASIINNEVWLFVRVQYGMNNEYIKKTTTIHSRCFEFVY